MERIKHVVGYLDIDGTAVRADIQGYVGQIKLFSDDIIKDFEYVKKCIRFRIEEFQALGNQESIELYERIYRYVSYLFEMLKEQRDCFLEFDNFDSKEDKLKYLNNYINNSVSTYNDNEVSLYMRHIIASLTWAYSLIEREYERVKNEGGIPNLPFETINQENDIISYDESDDPLKRALSALRLMQDYSSGKDAFIEVCLEYMDKHLVDYDEIYTVKNLMPSVVSVMKNLLESNRLDLIVVCSHYTGEREARAKNRLFREVLPFVIMLPESLLKFHTDSAQMGKRRIRSSKDAQIDRMNSIIARGMGWNTEDIFSILFEDSIPNLDGLNEENKEGIYFTNGRLNSGSSAQRYEQLPIWNNDILDEIMDRISQRINETINQKVKRILK